MVWKNPSKESAGVYVILVNQINNLDHQTSGPYAQNEGPGILCGSSDQSPSNSFMTSKELKMKTISNTCTS